MPDNGWTLETLFAYFNARLVDMDIRQQQRFDAQTKAIDSALIAQRTAIEAALVAADKATTKAEEASEKRFASVNEFRATLSDQASTLMSRAEALSMFERNAERIADITKRTDTFINRDAVLAEYDRVAGQLSALADRVTRAEGNKSGVQAGWGYIVAVVGLIAAIIATYYVVKHGG